MPDWRGEVRRRLTGVPLAPEREAEILEELSEHLGDRYRELRTAGRGKDEAERLALAELESDPVLAARLRLVERAVEAEPVVLGRRGGSIMGGVWQDVRYGVRALRHSAWFTAVAVLTLALGIGANSAIFQLLDAVTLRALPVQDPQGLAEVRIADRHNATGNFTGRRPQLTYALWQQIQDRQQDFSSVGAWGSAPFNLTTGGEARYAQGLWVSGDYFKTLGVTPLLGRVLTSADDERGCGSPTAVLSYPFWQREFGGDRSAVGRMLSLDGHPFEVIGVTPPAFFGVEVGWRFDVAVPICAEPLFSGRNSALAKGHYWWLAAMGRLKPGISATQASAQLDAASAAIFHETLPPIYMPQDAKTYLAFRFGAFPAATGVSVLRGTYQTPLWLLMAITGLVLLIACANLANLLLARASAREPEIAVRLALGASRYRLVRQLFVESMLVAVGGAVLALVVARAVSQLLVAFLDTSNNRLFVDLATDWRVLGFTGGLGLAACLLFGLAPAWRSTGTTPGAVMRAHGRGMTASRERSGLRRALVVAQVALSLVLVVGAGLFGRTFRNLMTVDPGFRQEGVFVTDLDLRPLALPVEKREAVHRDLLERLRAIPGVAAAAEAAIAPVTGSMWNDRVDLGSPDKPKELTYVNLVSAGFLTTMGTPLVAGRDFTDRDTVASPKVAIVTETFTRTFFKDKDPIGQRFAFQTGPGEPHPSYEIVGVMRDTKYQDLREPFRPLVFLDQAQTDEPDVEVQLFARSALPMGDLTGAIRRAVAGVNPSISLEFRSFPSQIRESLVLERLMATLSGCFGVLAGLIATVGLYGVMSYSVARRRNEIGVRLALGASRSDVVAMVVREAGLLLGIGLVTGTVIAMATGQAAGAFLFGLTSRDPFTYVTAITLLALVGLAAGYGPARHASRLDPMTALREG